MKIKKVSITGRKQNKLASKTAKKAIALLEEKGIQIEKDKKFLGEGTGLERFDSDLVIAFGGDGTLLATIRELKKQITVMEINCGNRGFLSAYDYSEIYDAAEAISKGEVKKEERARIETIIDGKKREEGLNEVLLVPNSPGRTLHCRMEIGNEVREEAGDGLIVATPTGSTAHALSAGGPIIKGNAKVFAVVSINPINWSHRPLIINDHETIKITEFKKEKPIVIIDGQTRYKAKRKIELKKGKNVTLAR